MTTAELSTLQRRTYRITLIRGRGPYEEVKEIIYTTSPLPADLARDTAYMHAYDVRKRRGWDGAEIEIEEIET